MIASRDRAASAAAVRRIADECGAGAASELGLDLGSLASVRRFVDELAARDLRLGALVCNAGLQTTSGPKLSPDGFELTFAVNHLGHFLLTNLLLARLAAAAPARIVVVASGVHDPKLRTGMPKADVADLETLAATGGPSRDRFDGRLAYVNSKLCNLWFVYELARRLAAAGLADGARGITVNGYDPGLVPGSGLARDYPAALRFVWDRVLPGIARVLSPIVPTINPAPKAGAALARLVLDPTLAGVTGDIIRRIPAGRTRRRPTHRTTRRGPVRSGRPASAWRDCAPARRRSAVEDRVMARAAFVLYVAFVAVGFVWRSWVQYRRTGDAGFRGFSRNATPLERAAGVLFVAGALACLVAPLREVRMAIPDAVRAGGLLLMAAGFALTVAAQLQMGDSWRIGVDPVERTGLVQGGLFERVRNPIFSGMLLGSLGLVLVVPNAWSIGGLAALVVAIETQVRWVEEPYLQRTHGDAYRSYARRVGRFVPGVGRWA